MFTVRPVFIGWVVLLQQLPVQLFMTLWSGGFFGGMITVTGIFTPGSSMPFLVCGGLPFFGVPLVAYFGKKLNYERTEYRFLDDRLEFDEGFLTVNRKIIKFKDIKEVTLRKGVIQRMYGLGTIYLATLATGTSSRSNPFFALGFGNISASGIAVRDVENSDEMYQRIQALLDVQSP